MHHVAAVRGAMSVGLDVIHPIINLEGVGIADGTREDMEKALTDAASWGIGIYTMKALGGGNLFRRAEECLKYAFSLPFAASRSSYRPVRARSSMSRETSSQSPSLRIQSRRSTLDESLMSIDGELVTVKSGPGSYTPVRTKRASTSFTLEATTRRLIGEPRSFA